MEVGPHVRAVAQLLEAVQVQLALERRQLRVPVVPRQDRLAKSLHIPDLEAPLVLSPAHDLAVLGLEHGVQLRDERVASLLHPQDMWKDCRSVVLTSTFGSVVTRQPSRPHFNVNVSAVESVASHSEPRPHFPFSCRHLENRNPDYDINLTLTNINIFALKSSGGSPDHPTPHPTNMMKALKFVYIFI